MIRPNILLVAWTEIFSMMEALAGSYPGHVFLQARSCSGYRAMSRHSRGICVRNEKFPHSVDGNLGQVDADELEDVVTRSGAPGTAAENLRSLRPKA